VTIDPSENLASYHVTNASSMQPDIDYQYTFMHDHMQEACYGMIPEEQLPATHLSIGRNLKEYSNQSDNIFEICNHIGFEPVSDLLELKERGEMALMNLGAARKSMGRAAFEHALRYSRAAQALSRDPEVVIHEIDRLGIDQVVVQALVSLAMYEEALVETQSMMETTTNELSSLVIGVERIRALRSVGRNVDAYELGMKSIESLGLQIPDNIHDHHQIMSFCAKYKENLDIEETIKVTSVETVLI